MKAIRKTRKICAVCGAVTRGAQWHNRDTGYGLCTPCGVGLAEKRGHAADEIEDLYGIRGIHWGLKERAPLRLA